MNPARVFALQSQRIGDHDNIPGGITEVDQSVASALCSGMRRECYLAGRLKWAGDWSVANELEYKLWIYAVDICNREKWRVQKGREMLRKMAGLAISEMAEPGRYKSDTIKANWLGVDKSNFSRTWSGRYNLVYQELDDMASRAFSYVMMKQRYDEQSSTQNV